MSAVLRSPAFRNYVLPLVLIVALLAVWEYAKQPLPKPRPQQAEDYGPPPPYNRNEEMWKEGRGRLRTSTLKHLDQPWANFCQPTGRELLVNSLKEYFYFRDGSEMSYPLRWGEVGKQYITREWSTAEDRRIEQQIKELYYRGYIDPKVLGNPAGKRVTALVQGLAVNRRPCQS
jgi:hypothetical protein